MMATKKSPKTGSPDESSSKKSPKAKAVTPTGKKRIAKTTSSKIAKLSLDSKTPVTVPVIPHDQIALRAYFIAERRQKLGWPGDSATDWADAVSQLRAEALEKPLKKR
jgi:hypothetical protein